MQSKKGQMDIVNFIIVFLGLMVVGIIVLYIVTTTISKFGDAINTTSPLASTTMAGISTSFVNLWDYVIAIAFLINVVMLFVFAFLVDTHPIFSFLYLISAVFILIFAPYAVYPIKQIFEVDAFSDSVGNLPITSFLLSSFGVIVLAVIVISGIIMFAKPKRREII